MNTFRLLKITICAVSVCHAMLASAQQPQPKSPVKESRAFQVRGNKILDPEGHRIILKGIAAPYGPFCGGVDDWDAIHTVDRDYDLIKGLGCNLVRICVTYKVTHTEPIRAKLIDVVAKARARGFVVEICNSYTSHTNNLTQQVGGQPCWLAWLANQWKDDPYVWLVPMNEPNGSPPGDVQKLGDWSYWQQEQNECIAAIRKAGNTAPLIVNTPGWSWDFSGIDKYPLTDPLKKIIYSAHRYANEVKSFTDQERAKCDAKWAHLAARYPLVVDEVGGQNPPHEMQIDWNRGFLSYCAEWVNQRDGCGVVAFNWYWCDDNSMSGDWRRGRNNGELTEWGRVFRDNYLNRVKSPE